MWRLYLSLLLNMLLNLIERHFRNLRWRWSCNLLWWVKVYVSAFLSNIRWRRLTLRLFLSEAILIRRRNLSFGRVTSIIVVTAESRWNLLALDHLKQLTSLRIVWGHCRGNRWNGSIISIHRKKSLSFAFLFLREQRVFAHFNYVCLMFALFYVLLGVSTISE